MKKELTGNLSDITRRDLFKGMGFVAAAGAAGAVGLAGCANNTEPPATANAADTPEAPAPKPTAAVPSGGGSYAEGALDLGWSGTPAALVALGESTMPLAELNRRRKAYLDDQTDYTCEDGTVIPALFVKVRALIHSYGMGCGNQLDDNTWYRILDKFSEDDAQAFLDMPYGEKFTVIDLYETTGRPLDQCQKICDHLAKEGFLCRFENSNGVTYHQVPFFQGVVEYAFTDVVNDPSYAVGVATAGRADDTRDTGTPTFYAVPCHKDVVADEGILPYDDLEQVIKSKKKLAIAPCYCRYTALIKAGTTDYPTFADFATAQFEDYFSPVCDQRVETCLMMGNEAEFWIAQGWAREISQEDAIRYMERSADDGFILQSCFTKDSETICSCHEASCGIIRMWNSVGTPEEVGASPAFQQISHYQLEVDFDSCIKCGTCMGRCPVSAITMDGEVNGQSGYPKVNTMCFRCGQCGYVCPQGARKLKARPAEQNAELSRDFLDDANRKAAYRFEQGLIANV